MQAQAGSYQRLSKNDTKCRSAWHSANKGSDLGSNLAMDWRPVQGGTLFSVASCHGNRG